MRSKNSKIRTINSSPKIIILVIESGGLRQNQKTRRKDTENKSSNLKMELLDSSVNSFVLNRAKSNSSLKVATLSILVKQKERKWLKNYSKISNSVISTHMLSKLSSCKSSRTSKKIQRSNLSMLNLMDSPSKSKIMIKSTFHSSWT